MTKVAEQQELVVPEVIPAAQPEQAAAPNPELRFEFSPSIGKLVEALAKASLAFKPVIKDATNPFFKSKYADLANVIEATREALGKNGLAVLQPPCFERPTGTVQIITLVAHSSSEWIKAILDMPVAKTDAQGVGSAITYGRRYAYSAVLNVASEDDDDGNAASKRGKPGDVAPDSRQMTDERVVECQDMLVACTTKAQLEATFAHVYTEAKNLGDKESMAFLINIKDKKKKELEKA